MTGVRMTPAADTAVTVRVSGAELAECVGVGDGTQSDVVRRALHLWHTLRVVHRGCELWRVDSDGSRQLVLFE